MSPHWVWDKTASQCCVSVAMFNTLEEFQWCLKCQCGGGQGNLWLTGWARQCLCCGCGGTIWWVSMLKGSPHSAEVDLWIRLCWATRTWKLMAIFLFQWQYYSHHAKSGTVIHPMLCNHSMLHFNSFCALLHERVLLLTWILLQTIVLWNVK